MDILFSEINLEPYKKVSKILGNNFCQFLSTNIECQSIGIKIFRKRFCYSDDRLTRARLKALISKCSNFGRFLGWPEFNRLKFQSIWNSFDNPPIDLPIYGIQSMLIQSIFYFWHFFENNRNIYEKLNTCSLICL